jgi:hypothetical protein
VKSEIPKRTVPRLSAMAEAMMCSLPPAISLANVSLAILIRSGFASTATTS